MHFLPEEIDKYVHEHTSNESELLYELNRQTHVKVLIPRMLSGHLQGRALSMISKMIQPSYVLEIGTYTGYSALCFAEGLRDDGKIKTIEIDPEVADFAKDYFNKSPYKNQIDSLVGNAMNIIPELEDGIDLVFMDADKSNYINYYELVLPKLKKGGFILLDNVLWSGKVTQEPNPKDKDTITLKKINKLIQGDDRVENVLLPIRDGLMLVRKI